MTDNEAIKEFEERLSIEGYKKYIPEYYAAMETAISALEEIQQYRALGTVEELRELVAKGKAYGQVAWERNIAISQLEEIGCSLGEKMDEAKEATEKQKVKKPFVQRTYEKTLYKCPCCKKVFVEAYENSQKGYIPKYCEMCGQSIDF